MKGNVPPMKAIVVKNLSYRYPDGREGLSGVDLEVLAGMKVCLLGRNGSGKTTLLLHLNGLLDGDGTIEVMGVRRGRTTVPEMRRRVGILFSHVEHHFIMNDLLNDVILSVDDAAAPTAEGKRLRAMEWLERFDLVRYRDCSPLELSAGEMKRAALAGVLAREPDVLLLDEPLQGLDRENAARLVSLLKPLEKTMLVATHQRFLVEEIATHVAVMERGKVAGLYTKREGLERKDVRGLLF